MEYAGSPKRSPSVIADSPDSSFTSVLLVLSPTFRRVPTIGLVKRRTHFLPDPTESTEHTVYYYCPSWTIGARIYSSSHMFTTLVGSSSLLPVPPRLLRLTVLVTEYKRSGPPSGGRVFVIRGGSDYPRERGVSETVTVTTLDPSLLQPGWGLREVWGPGGPSEEVIWDIPTGFECRGVSGRVLGRPRGTTGRSSGLKNLWDLRPVPQDLKVDPHYPSRSSGSLSRSERTLTMISETEVSSQ